MNTFLPYDNFSKSAECLDYKRLGKQRVEVWQIYTILKQIKEENNFKTLEIAGGKVIKLDNEDYEKYKFKKMWMGGSSSPSVQICKNNKKYYLHRLIMNCPKNYVVDHINRDTLDNRKSNLRICKNKENLRNRISNKGNSKYKGVSFDKTRNKWYACIRYNNKTYNLGRYKTEKEAGKVYDKQAKIFFKEYARLNFPKKVIGFKNHPAVQMWKGYEQALLTYGLEICREWIKRGYKDTMEEKILRELVKRGIRPLIYPSWLGDDDFHRAMRSNLLRKDEKYYRQFGWTEPTDLPYIWGEK